MKNVELLLTLNERRNKLIKIMDTNLPIIESQLEAHERKLANANLYLDELDEIISFLVTTDPSIKLANSLNFNKRIQNSDTYFIDFDGVFIKLACIGNFPMPNEWLLYMSPLNRL